MIYSEQKWDKILNIKTTGRDDSNANQFNYPYEPTPYCVLERLANSGHFRKPNTLLDYGCGKGRVDFFLSFQTRCKSIGIEYDERIYSSVEENKKTAAAGGRTTFFCENATTYQVPKEIDRVYFFNPFSVEILKSVLERVKESYYDNPREILLFFYYPSDEYVSYLMQVNELEFYDEIDCKDMFDGEDSRERVIIFRM